VKHLPVIFALLVVPSSAQAVTSSEYDKIDAQAKLDVLAGNNWYVPVGDSCIRLVDLAASWKGYTGQQIKSPNDFEDALSSMHFHPILIAQGRAPDSLPGSSLAYSVHLPDGTSPNVLIFNNVGTCQRIVDLHGTMIDIRKH
jgi:hypothetical protein